MPKYAKGKGLMTKASGKRCISGGDFSTHTLERNKENIAVISRKLFSRYDGQNGPMQTMDVQEQNGYNEGEGISEDAGTSLQLNTEDNAKLGKWKYRPDDSIYLKYKAVFDNPKYYNQETGEANYPGMNGDKNTNGFLNGKSAPDVMKAGNVYKRYGNNPKARYFTEIDTAYEQLSLSPGSDGRPLLEITVLKDIPCSSGEIAPWFDQPGGGQQYFTDMFVKDDNGNIVPATLDNLEKFGYIEIKVIK